jgi:hypothetical protein
LNYSAKSILDWVKSEFLDQCPTNQSEVQYHRRKIIVSICKT